jgi:DNA-binding transcriptional LysR family regulator
MKTTTDELLAFVTIVDSGSITAAAGLLGQTVSGVSRALARLETKLDATLLQRTTRRLTLSEEGTTFLARARAILDAHEDAEQSVSIRHRRPAGRLRVDAASPFTLHCIVPHMAEFAALFPEIRLELTTNDRVVELLEQRTDVAIRVGELQDSTLHARYFGVSRLRLLASPAYLAAHGEPRDVADLSAHRLLGFTEPDGLNLWPLVHAGGERYKSVPYMAASSGETLRQLALAGVGIACLSDFMCRADVQAGRLRPVLEALSGEHGRPVHAVYYRNTALAARITVFLDFIGVRLKL